ncbi:hypothetical protein OG592_05620 [Streptomyces avidinii]|uniref:hypothetical protein n=1 Tax=Streptomyces avidinii TaxID=1895 RepID=UPI00386D37C4|nr:hypothetical protein OG592_05620 [Streptomyces avidinii]
MRITEEASGEFQPSFAPGFSQPRQTIAFTSTRDVSPGQPFNHEIYRLDPESARLAMQLTFDPELDTEPAWSPTECKIAGTSEQRITSGPTEGVRNTQPDWQPSP